jgi:hypothetical protein
MNLKLSLLLLVVAFTYQANAQSTDDKVNILKGSIGLSGTASLNVLNSSGSFNRTTSAISPTASFFLSDNVALIVGLGYTNSSTTQTFFSTGQKDRSFLLGPVAGVAIYKPLIGRFGIKGSFLLGGRYGTRKLEQTSFGPPFTQEYDLLELSANIVPSIYYRVSDRWLIEASFGALSYIWNEQSYTPSGSNTSITTDNSTFDFSIRSGLGLGFTYLLKAK